MRPIESKRGCNNTLATVLWVPLSFYGYYNDKDASRETGAEATPNFREFLRVSLRDTVFCLYQVVLQGVHGGASFLR